MPCFLGFLAAFYQLSTAIFFHMERMYLNTLTYQRSSLNLCKQQFS